MLTKYLYNLHFNRLKLFPILLKHSNKSPALTNFDFNTIMRHTIHSDQHMKMPVSSLLLNQYNQNLLSSNQSLSAFLITKRSLAKGKDRGRDKNHQDRPKVILNDEELQQVIEIDEYRNEIDAMIEEFKTDLKLNYNVRLNPRVIESLEIQYDNLKVTLGDIVNIVRKQNDLIINLSATPSAVKSTMQAIQQSGLNLNPQQDGNIIYIRMPRITIEHRQALIKSVRAVGQKLKDRIKDKNFQKKFMKTKDMNRISKDLLNDVQSNLLFYQKQKCNEIDAIVKQKEDSLMNN